MTQRDKVVAVYPGDVEFRCASADNIAVPDMTHVDADDGVGSASSGVATMPMLQKEVQRYEAMVVKRQEVCLLDTRRPCCKTLLQALAHEVEVSGA